MKFPYPPSIEEIYAKADLLFYKNERLTKQLRALYFFLYLTGARLSEALEFTYNALKMEKVGNRHIYTAMLFTRKNRKKGIRVVPIIITNEYEQKMFDEFAEVYSHSIDFVFKGLIVPSELNDGKIKNLKYKTKAGEKAKVFEDRFASTKRRIERLFSVITFKTPVLDTVQKKVEVEEYRLKPHMLRHFRASHLYGELRLRKEDIIEIFGWSDDRMLQIYTQIYPSQLIESVISQLKQSGRSINYAKKISKYGE